MRGKLTPFQLESKKFQPGELQAKITTPRHHDRAFMVKTQERPCLIKQRRYQTISFSQFIRG